ncbi:unnamed protein product [Urochloa decumbens]|uniref:DUF4220 domain-containing protein n=1 Tax=Urochloa decumbens TaxID=240449 RepID=A0ABC9AJE1_9POAL
MGFSEAVLWWEEWQLRVLVLCSLFLQFFLCFAGYLRKRQIPSWLRFLIWLAFLGSDAAAIYALATLYNRSKRQEWVTMHRRSASLQALWAPILLVHLGGQDGITAYNIEDNELWRRNVLTAGSQVTVAIYVFCKSSSEDMIIFIIASILFFYGTVKCVQKAPLYEALQLSKSGCNITKLVHDYVAKGWTEHHIKDIATYRAFNDNRGQWTLRREGLLDILRWSLQRPFHESVLLWHLATDLCFHFMLTPPTHEAASQCREMSNYMAYLLFVNPEMLIPGGSRTQFKAAYRCINQFIHNDDGPAANTALDENEIALKIVVNALLDEDGSDIVQYAGKLASLVMRCSDMDEEKMWRVIQGVWVEMLCFSAGRCRGYLHAKSLGTGGEYLSYVWLLLLYMGMETLGEKMQRTELDEDGMAAVLYRYNQNI